MKHKIKKLINGSLACLMALSMFQFNWNVRAATKHNVTEEFPDANWKNQGNVTGIGSVLKVDGEVSFCLQATIPAYQGQNEEIAPSVIGIDQETMAKLALIVWYGYRSQPSTTNYFLTQNLIWQELGNGESYVKNDNIYPTKASMQTWFDGIMDKVRHFHDKPSFHNQTYTVNVNDTLTLQDTNGVLNGLTIENVSGAAVSKNGNTLYVTPNNNSADTLTINFNRGVSTAQTATNFVVRDKADNGRSQAVSPCTSGQDPYRSRVTVNVQKYGNLKITKLNEKGETVPNTKFKLSYNSNMSSPIGTYTTGSDGTVTISQLEPKTVYIQETEVPEPLELDDTIHSITVKSNETASYTARNNYKRADLKITKLDEKGNYISGTKFKISYNADMSDPIATYVTGSDGTVTAHNLIAKKVYIQETFVPEPLKLDSEIKSKDIEYGKVNTFTARNNYKRGDLKLAKVDETGKYIPNTKFKLSYHADMSDPIATYITGTDGTVTAHNLIAKKVYIQETFVPEPLKLDDTIHSATVKYNTTVTYTQRNEFKRVDLKLAKIDEDGNYIPNTKFKISYNSDMSDPIATYVTGSDGTVTAHRIIAKKVYIQETYVPDPLVLDNTIKSKVLEYGKVNTYTARNIYKVGDVEIAKLDADSGKIVKRDGVGFDIFKADGTYVATTATNTQGKALYRNLRYGDYYFVEKTEPPKYYISNERINFQIRENKAVVHKTISNPPIKGKIILNKEDCEVGKRAQGDGTLDGAVYTLYAQEDILDPADDSVLIKAGTEIKTATIKNYTATFDDLFLGKYRIKETTPPKKGYLLDKKDYIVNLTAEEHVKTVTSCDPVMKQSFQIAKFVDNDAEPGTKPPLEGAQFTAMLKKYVDKYETFDAAVAAAQRPNSEILPSEWDVLTTDRNGLAVSKELPYGLYVVSETFVPEGHEKAPDFEVDIETDDRKPKPYVFVNDPNFETIVAIVKKDAETHEIIPIKGATFKVKCLSDNDQFEEGDYVGWQMWNPLPHYLDTFTTTDNGEVMLPKGLTPGTYQIEEIRSPEGYLLAKTGKIFTISSKGVHQQVGPDDHTIVTTVVFEDTSVKGQVKLQKEAMLFKGYTSTQTDYGELFTPVYERGLLPGVKFEIKAVTDIVGGDHTTHYRAGQRVEILTTDGKTITTSSQLPLGTKDHNVYSIREIETAEGYVLDSTVHYFRFDYVDGNTAVVSPTWLDENGNVIDKDEILTLDNLHQTSVALATKVMETSDIKDKAEAYKKVIFGIFADQVDELQKDSLVSIVDVDKDGTASAKLTQKGKYYLKEITTDPDYVPLSIKYPFTYAYTGDVLREIQVNNGQPIYNLLKRGEIEIYKQDSDSQLPLMNVCFELATDKDFEHIIKTTWTDENGKALFSELETNFTYYIRERYDGNHDMVNKGYVYDPTVHEVTLQDIETIKVNLTNTQVKGKVQFTKTGESFRKVEIVDGDFGKEHHPVWDQGNLLGAELTVKAAEDIITWDQTTHYKKGEVVTVLESDWQTTDSLLLPVGKYEAYESKTPHGYIKDETIYTFEITPNGKAEIQLNAVTINNQRAKVNLNFIKAMETQEVVINKEAYKDVVYGVFAREDIYDYMGKVAIENNALIGISHIDENGHLINTFDLPNGVYYLKELQTNEQYNLDDNEYDFEIGYQGETTKEYTIEINQGKTIYNYLKRGSIEITKQDDETRKPLINVVFELATDKDFKNIIRTARTDEKGEALFDELEINHTYYVREQYGNENDMIHKGYVYNPTIYKIELGDFDGCIDYELYTNRKVWGQVQFEKLGEALYEFEPKMGDYGVEFHPKWEKSRLSGAELTVKAAEDITSWDRSINYKKGDIVTVVKSDMEFTYSDLLLPVGKYQAYESKAPDGYMKDETIYDFEIEPDGKSDVQMRPFSIYNQKAKVNLDFTKTLEKQEVFVNKDAYKDVVFGLYANEDMTRYHRTLIKKDDLIYTLHIDENGKLIMNDYLPSGKFYLKELNTNSQYQLDKTAYEFTIDYKDFHKDVYNVTVNDGETITNDLKRGSIEVIKTTNDEVFYSKAEQKYADSFHEMDSFARINKNPLMKDDVNYLAGVVFELATDKDFENIIATKKTDGDGRIVFNDLELGTYFIREKESLKHYVLTDEVFEVALTKHAQVEIVKVDNELVKANIGIHKVDADNRKLALKGAEFTMYADKACTKKVAATVTNELGNAIFKDISFGSTVYIKETKAPIGYELSEKVTKVIINDEWLNKDIRHRVIEITNHKIPETPKTPETPNTPNTGDDTNVVMYLGLLGFSLGAVLLASKRRHSNR